MISNCMFRLQEVEFKSKRGPLRFFFLPYHYHCSIPPQYLLVLNLGCLDPTSSKHRACFVAVCRVLMYKTSILSKSF